MLARCMLFEACYVMQSGAVTGPDVQIHETHLAGHDTLQLFPFNSPAEHALIFCFFFLHECGKLGLGELLEVDLAKGQGKRNA